MTPGLTRGPGGGSSPGAFRFPGGDQRTTILGATGSGKSTCGLWMLAHQRLDRRPWIVFDFKREQFFDRVGFPPIRHLSLADVIPSRPGLYLVSPRPGDDLQVDAFLWRVWEHENCGLYVDEAPLMPDANIFHAFPACIQQGRSKHIPIIACTQRPVGVARGLFSEASFVAVYDVTDVRDFKLIQGFVPAELTASSPPRFHWRYWDRDRRTILNMGPVPRPAIVAAMLANRAPYQANAWHPFAWTGRPSGREAIKLN
jgi:hypothetical protein